MPNLGFGYFTQPRGQGDPAVEPHPSHALMLADAQNAERLGFDAVWVPDHFYMDTPSGIETFPDCWTLLTAIGVTTERVRLGTMVLAASFRHPALLAKMAGALQELAGGRLLLGLGAGNQVNEHTAFDLGFERRVGRFKEYLPILTALLGGETVTREGRHYTLRGASLRTSVPPVPLLIASGGEQMHELAARYAQAWNPRGIRFDPAALEAMHGQLRAACRRVGRDPASIEVTLVAPVEVVADAAAARAARERAAAEASATPEVVERRQAIGTPDEVAARLRAMAAVGVDHFICLVNLHPRPETYWERVELLAREVLPRVRA